MVLFLDTLRLKVDSASANPVTQCGESSNSFTPFTVPGVEDTEVEYNLLVCHQGQGQPPLDTAGKAFKIEYTSPRQVLCSDNTMSELL